MRLLILWPDEQAACTMRSIMEQDNWDVTIRRDGCEALLPADSFDIILMHLCLPGRDGLSTGDSLASASLVCPPRILFAAPPEWCVHHPPWADCTVDAGTGILHICQLLRIIAQKPLPKLAAAQQQLIDDGINRLLDDLSLSKRMKGRLYAHWLLKRIIPSTPGTLQTLYMLYAECAQIFQTTPQAVERCLRVAVESVFTRGSIKGIERLFGATVDPERGKPTNRAFLMQAAQQLRYSLATARSLNSSEMHHNPAAPTSV